MEAESAPVTKKIATRTHGHGVEQVEQDRVEVQVGRAIGLEVNQGVRRLAGALGAFLEPDGAPTEDGKPDERDD